MCRREWGVIALFVGMLVSLILIAHFSSYASVKALKNFSPPPPKTVCVTLKGALENPGTYECPIGYTLKQLLLNIKLNPDADLKKISLNKIFYTSQEVEIPRKKGGQTRSKKISLEEK